MAAKMRFPDDMKEIFAQLTELTPLQRYTIRERYRGLMKEYRRRCRIYAALFYVCRITMTVGSLAVPALLSIQNTPGTSNTIYWFAWAVSLAVTTANGIMTLFKLDKRFFMLHATAERLRSETWQYVQLSGRYSGHHGHHKPTHTNQYVFYCSQLEKINMKRVNEEFIKTHDDAHPQPHTQLQPGQKTTSDTLVPSPPDLLTPSTKTSHRDSLSVVEDGESPDYKKKTKGSAEERDQIGDGQENKDRKSTKTSSQNKETAASRGSVIALQMSSGRSPVSPPSDDHIAIL